MAKALHAQTVKHLAKKGSPLYVMYHNTGVADIIQIAAATSDRLTISRAVIVIAKKYVSIYVRQEQQCLVRYVCRASGAD